jgi:sialate O-acetylesterase
LVALDGYWQAYWNGRKLTEMTYALMPGKDFACYFAVPQEQIRAGKNTLAIRIYSPAAPLAVRTGALWAGPVDLNGKWFAKVERSFPEINTGSDELRAEDDLQAARDAAWQPLQRHDPSASPYSIAGVLWYQGESNVKRAYEYRIAFPALIKGWEKRVETGQAAVLLLPSV